VPVQDHATVVAGQTLFTIESRPFRLALEQRRGRIGRRARPGRDPARHLARGDEASWPTPKARAAYFLRQSQRQEELGDQGRGLGEQARRNRRTMRALPPTVSPPCARSCSAC